jgi:hypothetical protein
MTTAMTTAAAKSPKPLRMNQKAELIPEARFAEWHEIASTTAGSSELDRAVLDAVAAYYRLLHERDYASFPSIEMMAKSSPISHQGLALLEHRGPAVRSLGARLDGVGQRHFLHVGS